MREAAPSVGERLRSAAAELADASTTARLDVELLMAAALGVSRNDLILRAMRDAAPPEFELLLARRIAHEPVAYIVGETEFYGLNLAVTPAVLIPRADSETLIEAARSACNAPPARILDLGTGSGALLLAALSMFPQSRGTGIDRSSDALAVARANGERTGLASRAEWLPGDWTQPRWADALGTFDLVLANPPYVESDAALDRMVADHEPHEALFAGPDGMDDYRLLVPALPALLAIGGVAIVEIGSAQGRGVSALAHAAGLSARIHCDLGQRERAVEMRRA
ncbi:MAG: protein-(glutamine-N5) methyltransferase, release factor-specific [Novosphingobium sp. 12-64-8]|nr:MAG: protein-(glutamine-N5) methyltransferase, release factor-specific [Novosphingobium sp. 12-64-8]